METYNEKIVTIFDVITKAFRPYCFYDEIDSLGIDTTKSRVVDNDEWRMYNVIYVDIPKGLPRQEFLNNCYKYSYMWQRTNLFNDIEIEFQRYIMNFDFEDMYTSICYWKKNSRSENTSRIQLALKLGFVSGSTEFPISDKDNSTMLYYTRTGEKLISYLNFLHDNSTKIGFYK